ncbi:hypothetical protein [uncultured Rikenella sp.]|nr:hypothetical protein [uncultured Rikenella sp.]
MSVGNAGFSWSATTSDISGLNLDFHSQGLNTNHSGYHALGLQLRCLSE